MNKIFLIIATILLISISGAQSHEPKEQKLTLRGRVIFPNGSPIPIEAGGKLIVELQDVSLADAPSKRIARGIGKAIRFPMAFAIKYSPKQLKIGLTYALHAMIKSKNNELLYTNDVRIQVTPVGLDRTILIDVPVILVKKTESIEQKTQWPEFLGKSGKEAVRIIKQETGFTNVVVMSESSPATLDYRTDRVRVFIDKNGIVTSVPTIS